MATTSITSPQTGIETRVGTRTWAAMATIAGGLVILSCVGFLQTPAVHNGAHDTRHATGFPCR